MPLRGTNPLKANFTHAFSFPCTAADLCKQNNGGCHKAANCTQLGVKIFCNCQKGYKGDGFTCLPINPCADGFNGGCHEHAICTVIGPVSWMIWVFIGKSETLPPARCQQVFPARPHSLPLRAPFPRTIIMWPQSAFQVHFGILSDEGWGKGCYIDRMFCMHSFSVLFFALPSWLSLFAIEVWQHETVCILVPKPRDGWENNITFWLIRPSDNSCSHMILGTKCQSDRGNDLIQHLSWCFWDHLSVPFWWFAWCVFQELSRKASLLIRSSC